MKQFFIFCICVWVIFAVLAVFTGEAQDWKESEAAYQRMKDRGYSSQEIYDMGR